MADLNRAEILGLLRELGAPSDEAALKAARALDRHLREAGLRWDDLLRPEGADEPEPVDEPEEAAAEAPPAAAEAKPVPANRGEDMRIIERLLARKDLSDTLRGDLNEFKKGIADGSFDRTDAEYLRALAKRLGA